MVRSDLNPGQQLAQAVHAALEFFHRHPFIATDWITLSNYLVVVNAPTEDHLHQLIDSASLTDVAAVAMREPDLNDQVTAVALQPGLNARRLCSQLPLALKGISCS